MVAVSACLGEDELLELARGTLGDSPGAEAHLASCASCSALLAVAMRHAARAHSRGRSLVGTTLGPYRLDAELGAGGMGVVYRAWDPRLGRALALKILHAGTDRGATEARAAAAIDHRAIVGIHEVGVLDGRHYVAMELVAGESLRSALARGPVGVARARELLLELVDALVAAHARGVVHRDLKPENLVVGRDGLRVLDFGIAKLVDAAALDVTEPGTVLGTAGYMAPEQARGEPADARTDLFAAGAIAYELATGRRAFGGATAADRLSATLRDTPPLDELGDLAPIVARCLAKEPAARFQTAADLAWALRQLPAASSIALATRSTTVARGTVDDRNEDAASRGADDERRDIDERTVPPTRVRRGVSRRGWLLGGAAAVAAGAIGAFGFWVGRRGRVGEAALTFRSITHRVGRVYTARFAADGNRVVFGAAWASDPVRVHELDLASGQTTVLELPGADLLAISPHDELAIGVGQRFVDHQSAQGEVARVVIGGTPRPLATSVQDADFVGPRDELAVVRAVGAAYRVELPIGTTVADGPGWVTHVRASPDGARLAYLRHPHSNDDSGALVVRDLAARTERVLASGWTSIAGLAWDPAGDSIWFTASRDDLDNSLHRASLAGDVAAFAGPTGSRLRLHDIARDRRALVTSDAWHLRALAGERDISIAEVSYITDLSADGSRVLIGELGELGTGSGAYLVPYETGRVLRLGDGFPLALSPSGERVALNVDALDHVAIASTRSAETSRLAAPGPILVARWLSERSLIAHFADQLWHLAPDSKPFALVAATPSFALDPLRTRCAFVDLAGHLSILDLETREVRALPVTVGADAICGWLSAPDAIVLRTTTTPLVLSRIDAATGARSPHLTIQPPLLGLKAVDTFVLSSSGTRYAYSYGQELSQLGLVTLPA